MQSLETIAVLHTEQFSQHSNSVRNQWR